ncbi:hypothetical protein NDU88_000644 [Pleurodeles waltl]|uniref:Uncharacterized protein n=1 Tax=Pleurodeles waltl TaxID=8319 RepID=A0AAV7Q1U6_PLEWA|nr:hypothetical protein NDU88_000644 [Pleurodeles waltl]
MLTPVPAMPVLITGCKQEPIVTKRYRTALWDWIMGVFHTLAETLMQVVQQFYRRGGLLAMVHAAQSPEHEEE